MFSEKNEPDVLSGPELDKTDGHTDNHVSFVNKLRRNKVYRRKFVLTLAIFWSYVNLGWVVVQIGTALPDLQSLLSIDIETASWLFTSWSLGFVVGSLFCGILYDRVNRLVIMFVCTFGVGICSVCLPHSKTFPIMITVRVVTGLFCGGIDTGANTIVPSIWGSEVGPFMQALYLFYTLGSISSPLATEPFMSFTGKGHITTTTRSNYTDKNYCVGCHDDDKYRAVSDSKENSSNNSYAFPVTINQSTFRNATQNLHNVSRGNLITEDMHIYKAFMMTGGLVLCSAIPYLIMVLIGDFDIKAKSKVKTDDVKEQEVEPLQVKSEKIIVIETATQKIEGKRRYFVLAFIACVNLLYSATENSFSDFIVSFALDYLAWESTSSVWLISLYWVASCIGGLSGIFLARILRPTRLLLIAHLFWMTTFLLSLIASFYRIDVMIWIFTPSSGFFMVLIIPAAISWTEEHVCHVTGQISSLFMMATGSGIAMNPTFIGFMMEKYTYISFLCILFVESVICFGFYILAYIFRHFRYKPETGIKEEMC